MRTQAVMTASQVGGLAAAAMGAATVVAVAAVARSMAVNERGAEKMEECNDGRAPPKGGAGCEGVGCGGEDGVGDR